MLNDNNTAELPQANTVENAKETTEVFEEPIEQDYLSGDAAASEKPHGYWYQKLGRSVGASIGVAACGLVIVSLAAGFSAFAGTQVGKAAHATDRPEMEQSFDQGRDNSDSRQGKNMDRDFGSETNNKGTTPDRGANGTKGANTPSDTGSNDQMTPSDSDMSSSSRDHGNATQSDQDQGGKSTSKKGQNAATQNTQSA